METSLTIRIGLEQGQPCVQIDSHPAGPPLTGKGLEIAMQALAHLTEGWLGGERAAAAAMGAAAPQRGAR